MSRERNPAIFPAVALFKHILDFKRSALAMLRDKRKAKRYQVDPAFPVKATIVLPDTETVGRRSKTPYEPQGVRSWDGLLFNMSTVGLSLHLPGTAAAKRGEATVVTLLLDGHQVKLPCQIAHFRVDGPTAHCGLTLTAGDLAERKAYLQLLEAVILGSTLAPVKRGGATRDGLRAEQYKTERKTLLTAWRRDAGNELHSFEFVVGNHCLRGEAKHPALEIFSNAASGAKTAWSAPGFSASQGGVENEELRKLFRWITLNLSRPVPADLREMMRSFANSRADWAAPGAKARGSAPTLRSKPGL